jgi:8-oxo-dGTP pyrophosphatase MutT (NUDIX family)
VFKEFSCGAVVYKMRNSIPVFLLVNSKQNRKWGFPKGHVENDEGELETAAREIFEETGIKDIVFIENFRQEDIYMIDGVNGRVIEKHSVYFLALAREDSMDFDRNEILKVCWADIKNACNMLPFENQKKIINLAYNFIIGGKYGQSAFKR